MAELGQSPAWAAVAAFALAASAKVKAVLDVKRDMGLFQFCCPGQSNRHASSKSALGIRRAGAAQTLVRTPRSDRICEVNSGRLFGEAFASVGHCSKRPRPSLDRVRQHPFHSGTVAKLLNAPLCRVFYFRPVYLYQSPLLTSKQNDTR